MARSGLVLHAYVLMRNYYHLLLETPEANLAGAMRQLNGVYTQDFNGRHGRVGEVAQAARFAWSSAAAYAGDVRAPDWLRTVAVLSHFGRRRRTAQRP